MKSWNLSAIAKRLTLRDQCVSVSQDRSGNRQERSRAFVLEDPTHTCQTYSNTLPRGRLSTGPLVQTGINNPERGASAANTLAMAKTDAKTFAPWDKIWPGLCDGPSMEGQRPSGGVLAALRFAPGRRMGWQPYNPQGDLLALAMSRE